MASTGAEAQAWPSRPITLYVPFAAGGPSDMFGRILARGLTAELGQQVVVENKGGMGGVVGVAAVAKAAPDGYTIGMNATGPSAIAPFMVPNMPFEDKDLVLLTPIALVQMIIGTSSRLPVNSVAELIAYAKANPGKVNYGSSGPGGISHLAAELFRAAAGIDIVHVPYRGAAPAVQDLLAGQVQMVVLDVSAHPVRQHQGLGGNQQDPRGPAARCADHGRDRPAHGALGQLVRACRAGRCSQGRS
jgi:tripartite-type tricarboxylate transporter receptor subunit TctC